MTNGLVYTILDIIPVDNVTERAIQIYNPNRIITTSNKHSPCGCYLRLSFDLPPREIGKGFTFGYSSMCDIILNSNTVATSHFSIMLNNLTGVPLVKNESSSRMIAGDIMLTQQRSRVVEQAMFIHCGNLHFMAYTPNRGTYQQAYTSNLGRYLGTLLGYSEATVMGTHAKPIRSQKHIGKYIELKRLGSGGFGEVCVFLSRDTGEIYAGKRFKRRGNVMAVKKEIKTLQSLKHKNIVKFIDAVQENKGSLCLMMEYISQGTLAEQSLTRIQAVEATKQCLDGLAYIHSHNIMHRDIKPDNIVVKLLMPLQIYIVDFGLAREGPIAGSRAGTRLYIAPEIWDGQDYTCAVDVWALGLTFLAMLGKLPTRNPHFLGCAIRSNRPTFMRAVREVYQTKDTIPDLIEFFDHILDENPQTRWSSQQCRYSVRTVQGAIYREKTSWIQVSTSA